MSTACATSSNRQSGARIWAAWSGRARRGLPGRPDGCSGSAGASAGRGLGPAARDAPSAQGPAARSSEGVGGAGTLPRRGGAGARGGALTRPGGARGGGRGSPRGGPEVGRSCSPRSGVVPPPALPHSQTRRPPARQTQVQTCGRQVTPSWCSRHRPTPTPRLPPIFPLLLSGSWLLRLALRGHSGTSSCPLSVSPPLLCGLTVWCAPSLLCLVFSTESCVLSGHGLCMFPAQPAGSPSSLIPSDRHLINSLAKGPGTWTLFPPTLSTGWGTAGAVLTLSQPDPSAYPADLPLPSPPQIIPVIIMGAISFEACVLGVVLSTLHIISSSKPPSGGSILISPILQGGKKLREASDLPKATHTAGQCPVCV